MTAFGISGVSSSSPTCSSEPPRLVGPCLMPVRKEGRVGGAVTVHAHKFDKADAAASPLDTERRSSSIEASGEGAASCLSREGCISQGLLGSWTTALGSKTSTCVLRVSTRVARLSFLSSIFARVCFWLTSKLTRLSFSRRSCSISALSSITNLCCSDFSLAACSCVLRKSACVWYFSPTSLSRSSFSRASSSRAACLCPCRS
mmetsp:Transcript_39307/g.98315  ORF Transcript_39307/g.98315 Transcript_39307/m.98315 type:complete len:203 (-) Transcript_39307:43-651(-)